MINLPDNFEEGTLVNIRLFTLRVWLRRSCSFPGTLNREQRPSRLSISIR